MKQFFLSGLPRTGSTLLSNILAQNNTFHIEGNSAVCQIMWDIKQSCEINAQEQLKASHKEHIKENLIKNVWDSYYKISNKKIIMDKCRSWTLPNNLDMIEKYIDKNPKIIVMTRPIIDIVKSFEYIYRKNNIVLNQKALFEPNTDPLMIPLAGLDFAKKSGRKNFLFISYNSLIDNTEETLEKIYDFLNIEKYSHNLLSIKDLKLEDDSVFGLNGFHEIRSKIEKRNFESNLSDETIDICNYLDSKYPFL